LELPDFVDYLRSGWGINLSLAIDYTASNGDNIYSKASLHFQSPDGQLNMYEKAIMSVGQVMEPYATNSKFGVYGFGGIPRFMNLSKPSHCFHLNGTADPVIVGFQNVF
jgi:hypothetical protein